MNYLLDQPTVYGDLVKAHDSQDNIDCNSLNLKASDGFSVTNVDKVGNMKLCYELYFSVNFNHIQSTLTLQTPHHCRHSAILDKAYIPDWLCKEMYGDNSCYFGLLLLWNCRHSMQSQTKICCSYLITIENLDVLMTEWYNYSAVLEHSLVCTLFWPISYDYVRK